MMSIMYQMFRKSLLVLCATCLLSVEANAQEEASDRPDARLEGYASGNGQVTVIQIDKGGGHAATWFILAGLGVIGLGVMFKPGKRSHLD